jgi:hypothetical protein
MWIVVGFASLGLLIGTMTGMSSESVVKSLISLLFVFVGGSVLALLHRLTPHDRNIAGGAIFGMSLGCLLGLYSGIFVSEHRVLTPGTAASETADVRSGPKTARSANGEEDGHRYFYLRASMMSKANAIDIQKKAGLSVEEAYEQMYQVAQECAGNLSH